MHKFAAIALALALLPVNPAWAEVAVVVHPDSGVTAMDRAQVINIFMGRYRKFPSGADALPVDLSPAKQRFYRALVNKPLSEISAYWARLVFSGRARPPEQVDSVEALQHTLRRNPNAIGFVGAEAVTDDMYVVLTLPEPEAR